MKTQVQTQECMNKSRVPWHTCNGGSAGEKGRRSHWPARLGYLVNSRPMNKSVSKIRQLLSKGTGGLSSDFYTHTLMHAPHLTLTHTYTHT